MKRLSDMQQREHDRVNLEAEERLAALTPDDTDATIADVTADYLLSLYPPPYRISVIHDTSVRHVRRIEKELAWCKENQPDSVPMYERVLFHSGPCLLAYDWSNKNVVGIKTNDREQARNWLLWAFALGYSPSVSGFGGLGFYCGQGSIGQIRERMAEEIGRFAKAAERERAERRKASQCH